MYRCYKIIDPTCKVRGLEVSVHTLACGQKINVVACGEPGRGRKLSFIPIAGIKDINEEIHYIDIGLTRSGKLKFINIPTITGDSKPDVEGVILQLLTPIGFRGGNEHVIPEDIEILASGVIAQGKAGFMGSGKQYILKVTNFPRVINIKLTGRLYGDPSMYNIHIKGPHEVMILLPGEEDLLDEDLLSKT